MGELRREGVVVVVVVGVVVVVVVAGLAGISLVSSTHCTILLPDFKSHGAVPFFIRSCTREVILYKGRGYTRGQGECVCRGPALYITTCFSYETYPSCLAPKLSLFHQVVYPRSDFI